MFINRLKLFWCIFEKSSNKTINWGWLKLWIGFAEASSTQIMVTTILTSSKEIWKDNRWEFGECGYPIGV